jgi:hypothetical protein
MYDTKHNAVLITRRDCDQLFFVFTGIMQKVFGLGPLEFLQASGLGNRNVVILRDVWRTGYLAGCSDQIRSFDALIDWQREIVNGAPHLRRIYSIGVSSGALAAMLSAERLGAESSLIFGPRVHSLRALGVTPEVRESGASCEITAAERLVAAIHTWRARLRKLMGLTAHETLPPPSIRKAWFRDFEPLLTSLAESSGSTVHHLYYVPSNPIDSLVVGHLVQHCKQVRPHVVIPPAEYPGALKRRPGWDHNVIPILLATRELQTIIPSFERPTA